MIGFMLEAGGSGQGRRSMLPCPLILYYVSEHGVEYYLYSISGMLRSAGPHPNTPLMPTRIPSRLYAVYVLPVVKAWSAHPQFDSGQ
jgi:hypothetical protein